jgi:cobalt-zinc-cadmium efflux system outer membrane protein
VASLRPRPGALVVLACLAVAPGAGAQQAGAEIAAAPLSFDGTIALAFEKSPELRARAAEVQLAEANLLGARSFPFNPVIGVSRARRDDGFQQTHDREIGISQELEIAGQRPKRLAAATASLEASRWRFERERQAFAARVGERFVESIRARELAALAAFEREIVRSLADFEQRRLDAGAGTLIDLNLARAAEGRAERQVELARSAETAARAALAESVGLSPAELPQLVGELPASWPPSLSRDQIEQRALAHRQDLAALGREVEAASARLRLERALAAPNLVLGVARGREADAEDLDTISAGVAIPVFRRNQGGIAAARAGELGFEAELAAATLAVRSDALTAASRFEATSRALAVFRETVAGTLDENLELVQKSFASGKLRASEVLVFRREFVDSRRELIEAAADAWLARIALDLATGDVRVPVPMPNSTFPETSR